MGQVSPSGIQDALPPTYQGQCGRSRAVKSRALISAQVYLHIHKVTKYGMVACRPNSYIEPSPDSLSHMAVHESGTLSEWLHREFCHVSLRACPLATRHGRLLPHLATTLIVHKRCRHHRSVPKRRTLGASVPSKEFCRERKTASASSSVRPPRSQHEQKVAY